MNALGSNLVLYSLQIACIVAIAAIGASLCRVPLARVRLAYWRLVVAVCIAIPFLSRVAPHAIPEGGPTVASRVAFSTLSGGGTPVGTWFWLIPFVSIAGAIVRCAWLAFGVVRLRRLRELGSSEPFESEVAGGRRGVGAGDGVPLG